MAIDFIDLKIKNLKAEVVKLSIEINKIKEGKEAYTYANNMMGTSDRKSDRLYRIIMQDSINELVTKINGILEKIQVLEKEKEEI